MLKKEFQHHQDRLEELLSLRELALQTADGNLLSNHLRVEEPGFDPNALDGQAKALKEDYERLHRMATNAHLLDFAQIGRAHV